MTEAQVSEESELWLSREIEFVELLLDSMPLLARLFKDDENEGCDPPPPECSQFLARLVVLLESCLVLLSMYAPKVPAGMLDCRFALTGAGANGMPRSSEFWSGCELCCVECARALLTSLSLRELPFEGLARTDAFVVSELRRVLRSCCSDASAAVITAEARRGCFTDWADSADCSWKLPVAFWFALRLLFWTEW